MPNPSLNDVHYDRPLANVAINYIQERDRFIADKVFPYVPVQKQSDMYYAFDKDDWLRDEAELRAPGAESAGGGYRVDASGNVYSCNVYAYHKDVADQIRDNSDNPLQPDKDATKFVTQKLLIQREKMFTDTYLTTGVWDTDFDVDSSSTQWDDPDTGSPVKDVQANIETVAGAWDFPNRMIVGFKAYNTMKQHDDLTDRIKYTQKGIVTEDLIGNVFDVDEVYVGRSLYATNNEGGTESMSYIIPTNSVFIGYAQDSPAIDMPSCGYIFGWEGLEGSDGYNLSIKVFRMEQNAADRIEGQMAYDMKATGTALGAYMHDCAA